MDELKACPFCGGKAMLNRENARMDTHLKSDGFGGFERIEVFAYDWSVNCKECGVVGVIGSDHILRKESGEVCVVRDGRKLAINAWNRRAAK